MRLSSVPLSSIVPLSHWLLYVDVHVYAGERVEVDNHRSVRGTVLRKSQVPSHSFYQNVHDTNQIPIYLSPSNDTNICRYYQIFYDVYKIVITPTSE